MDTIREPMATDPRLYRMSRFIEENTGRNGISCCIKNNQQFNQMDDKIQLSDSVFKRPQSNAYYHPTAMIHL